MSRHLFLLPATFLATTTALAPLNPTATLEPSVSSTDASLLAEALASCPHPHGCSADSLDALDAEALAQVTAQYKSLAVVREQEVITDTETCYNGCFDRGTCESGLCQCTTGAGFDCGIDEPVRRDDGFVYVYDINASQGLSHYVRDHGDSNYHAEVLFFKRLMSDFSVRTLDPAKAKLFYTPTFAYFHQNNVCFAPECVDLAVFGQTATHWAANPNAPKGEDHVYFFTGDKVSVAMRVWHSVPSLASHPARSTLRVCRVTGHVRHAVRSHLHYALGAHHLVGLHGL